MNPGMRAHVLHTVRTQAVGDGHAAFAAPDTPDSPHAGRATPDSPIPPPGLHRSNVRAQPIDRGWPTRTSLATVAALVCPVHAHEVGRCGKWLRGTHMGTVPPLCATVVCPRVLRGRNIGGRAESPRHQAPTWPPLCANVKAARGPLAGARDCVTPSEAAGCGPAAVGPHRTARTIHRRGSRATCATQRNV